MQSTLASADAAAEATHWRKVGDAHHAHGDVQAGGEAHMKALAASTRDPKLVTAANALTDGNLAVAERLLKQHLKAYPTDIGAMRMLAELATRIGRLGEANALLDRALELAPSFDTARFARALVLARRNHLPEAIADTDRLLAATPDNLACKNLRASILVRLGDFEKARALYEEVLRHKPNDPRILMSLGHILKTTGRLEEGVDMYRRSIALRPELGESWWSLANLKTYRFSDADVGAMQAALNAASADDDDRLHLHFALGKAFEDRRDYAKSFEHYNQGNALRRSQIDYDADELTAKVEAAKKLISRDFFKARQGGGSQAPDPIFIVGLPRSGSTLLEQILASHPLVEGTMELPDLDMIARRLGQKDDQAFADALTALSGDDLRALGEEYLQRTRMHRRQGRPFFIDKLPNNWLNVGFIPLVLPNAKIIDARRHPMATCFSAWKQHFARGQSFTFDQRELGRYYADYVALMAHMDQVAPKRVIRVIHEDLLNNPEREIRRLLDRLGLPFDQRCLDFHENDRAVRTPSSEQVRRPISKDGMEQWKHYERWLEPLATELKGPLKTWNAAAA